MRENAVAEPHRREIRFHPIDKEVQKYLILNWIESHRGIYPKLNVACSHWANAPEANPSAVWALSTIAIDAINLEPLRTATGAPAASRPTDHITAYPGGGASKKIMAVAIALFQQHDRPNSTTTEG